MAYDEIYNVKILAANRQHIEGTVPNTAQWPPPYNDYKRKHCGKIQIKCIKC